MLYFAFLIKVIGLGVGFFKMPALEIAYFFISFYSENGLEATF